MVARRASLHSTVVRAAYENEKKVRQPAVWACAGRRRRQSHLRRPRARLLLGIPRCCALRASMQGAADSMDFRIFFKQQKDGAVVSPWHDIPLYSGAPPGHHAAAAPVAPSVGVELAPCHLCFRLRHSLTARTDGLLALMGESR